MGRQGRTKQEIASDRLGICQLYLRGMSQSAIGEQFGLTQQQISVELKAIRQEWLDSRIRDFDEAKDRELAKIDNLEQTFWQGWERSILDREKLVKEKTDGGDKPGTKVRREREGQAGDPRFLQGVLQCISKRCEILGLNAPDRIEDVTPNRTMEILVNSREEAVTVQELLKHGRFSNN